MACVQGRGCASHEDGWRYFHLQQRGVRQRRRTTRCSVAGIRRLDRLTLHGARKIAMVRGHEGSPP
jgi:hypothetical protein